MSMAFGALRQTGRNFMRQARDGLGEMREGLRDSLGGMATLLRNAARAARMASGETKAAALLCLGLTGLVLLPTPAQPGDTTLTQDTTGAPVAVGSTPPYTREPWRAVPPKLAVWRLEAPQLASSVMVNRLRTLPDGARQDLLVWPPGDTTRLAGALSVERYRYSAPEPDSLYVETARRAALAGASIERMAQGAVLETKFGVFDSADTLIDDGAGPRPCIAFRQLSPEAPARISGWFCGGAQPLDRITLGCVLNRLDLVSSGEDSALRGWFAAAERNRRGCDWTSTGSIRWMDPGGRMPALKRDVSLRPAASTGQK